jgi:hypothetical protein
MSCIACPAVSVESQAPGTPVDTIPLEGLRRLSVQIQHGAIVIEGTPSGPLTWYVEPVVTHMGQPTQQALDSAMRAARARGDSVAIVGAPPMVTHPRVAALRDWVERTRDAEGAKLEQRNSGRINDSLRVVIRVPPGIHVLSLAVSGRGGISVDRYDGEFFAQVMRGSFRGRALGNSHVVMVQEGGIDVELSRLRPDYPVSLMARNGPVRLKLPATPDVTVDISIVCGTVRASFPIPHVSGERIDPRGPRCPLDASREPQVIGAGPLADKYRAVLGRGKASVGIEGRVSEVTLEVP